MVFRLLPLPVIFLIACFVFTQAVVPRVDRLIRRELSTGVPGDDVTSVSPPVVLLQPGRLNGSDDATPDPSVLREDSITFARSMRTKEKRPQDTCYDAVDVAAVGSDLEANRDFWRNRCYMFGREIAAIRVTMGANVDYFKPANGNSNKAWCSMMQSNQRHLWSNDAINWKQPVYVKAIDYSDYLGGSDQTWPVGQGQDEREFISFWGGARVKGGCCSDKNFWDKNRWENRFVLSTCNRCSSFATIPGGIKADKKYWMHLCETDTLPDTATMIRVTVGFVSDYYRPVKGVSICEMLLSHKQHLWSDDGINFTQPRYGTSDHLGGSEIGWPNTNVVGDQRQTLNYWGSTSLEGGCCSTSLRDECDHGKIEECFSKPVEVEYCH
jgi:hypothetical protein